METCLIHRPSHRMEEVDFQIVALPSLMALGRQTRLRTANPGSAPMPNPVPKLWADSFRDGLLGRLQDHPWRRFPETLVGWTGDPLPDGSFRYVAGILVDPDAWVPEACVTGNLPKGHYARLTLRGHEPTLLAEGQSLLDRRILGAGRVGHPHATRLEWYGPRYCEDLEIRAIELYCLLADPTTAPA